MQLNQESTDYLDWFRAVIDPMVRRRIEEGATKYGDLLPAEHDDRDFALDGDVADHVPVTHSRYDCVDDRQLTLF
jgi:hypothetical protein